jgi:ABC-type transporter Mla subunit MlaD
MVHGLGRAFYPSLAALFSTVVVVIARGFYVQKAMRLSRALDSLAFDYFLLEFSPRTLTEDFTELSAQLSAVADTMSERDTAFAQAAESLAKSIEQIKLLGPVVQKAGEDASEASSKLAKDTNNVVSAFAKHLAENSPLFTAVGQLKESASTIDLSVNRLTDVAQNLTISNGETGEMIENLTIALKEAIDGVPELIRVACGNGVIAINKASAAVSSRAKESADALIERLDATTKKIETTKTDIGQAIAADLDKQINTSVDGLKFAVSQTTKDLNEAAKRITQAAQNYEPTRSPAHHLGAEKKASAGTNGATPASTSSESDRSPELWKESTSLPVHDNPWPPKKSKDTSFERVRVKPEPSTQVVTLTEKPLTGESGKPNPEGNNGTDDTPKRSWGGRIRDLLRVRLW